jgi:hypothetical protein
MPFHVFHPPETNSPSGRRTQAPDQQICAASDLHPASSISSSLSLSTFLGQLVCRFAGWKRSLKNLTEFLFAHNVSKPDLEVL